VGACLTGCPAALVLAGFNFGKLLERDKITIKGEVELNGIQGVKIGAMKYFESSEGTGNYKLADGDALDPLSPRWNAVIFEPRLSVPLTGAATDGVQATGAFALELQSDHRVAQFLLIAWSDTTPRNGRYEWEELRAGETFLITKSGGSFYGLRASGSVLAPFATTGIAVFGDVDKVKTFKFAFPPIEEAPIGEEPTSSI
jgi:hypothetical protein